MRGEVRKCDEVRAERRVKGLVREDMVVCFFWGFFLGGQWVYELVGLRAFTVSGGGTRRIEVEAMPFLFG